MAMSSDNNTVASNSIVYELSIFDGKTIQTLLDDMIAIEVLNQLHYTILQRVDNGLDLLLCGNEFNHLLQCSSSMLVQRDLDHLRSSVVDKRCTLLIVGELQQFLTQVISKGIYNQLA